MKMKIIKSNRNWCQLWCIKRDERKWEEQGRSTGNENKPKASRRRRRRLRGGNAAIRKKENCCAIENWTEGFALGRGGEGCCVGGWVWSVNDKQTSDVLRRLLRLRLRPGADKKNCQSALKVCNASKVSCKIDKYNADRQLLQLLLLLLLPLLHCYCNNNIDSAFASRQSAGEGTKMGKKSSAECRLVIAANAAEAADRCRNSLIKFYWNCRQAAKNRRRRAKQKK